MQTHFHPKSRFWQEFDEDEYLRTKPAPTPPRGFYYFTHDDYRAVALPAPFNVRVKR